MKTIQLVGLICMVSASGYGCRYNGQNGSSPTEERLTAITNVVRTGELAAELDELEVQNQFGELVVTGSEKGPVEWTWELRVSAVSEEKAQQAASAAACKSEHNGRQLRLIVSLPASDRGVQLQSDLHVRAPKSVRIRAENRFGPIEVSDFSSSVDVTDRNGSVEIRKIAGKVDARTSFARLAVGETGETSLHNENGQIEAEQIRGSLTAETSFASLAVSQVEGPVRLNNRNGAIELSKAGSDAEVRTSYASLKVEQVGGNATLSNRNGLIRASGVTGSVDATTSFARLTVNGSGRSVVCHNQNGQIEIHLSSPVLNKLEAQTSFADLTVTLPAALRPIVFAQTSHSEVKSDFPLAGDAGEDIRSTDAEMRRPQVKLENQNGLIRVMRE